MKRSTIITIAAALALSAALIIAGFNPAEALTDAIDKMDEQTRKAVAWTLIAVAYGPLFLCGFVAIWKGFKGNQGGRHE